MSATAPLGATLTSTGRRVLDAVLPAVLRAQGRILAPLAEAVRARFVALRERLADLHRAPTALLRAAE